MPSRIRVAPESATPEPGSLFLSSRRSAVRAVSIHSPRLAFTGRAVTLYGSSVQLERGMWFADVLQ